MSHNKSIEAIETYRSQLGESRVDFFKGLWEVADRTSGEDLPTRFTRILAYLDTYQEGLVKAADSFKADTLKDFGSSTLKAVDIERMAGTIVETCGLDPEGRMAPFVELALVTAVQPDIMRIAAAHDSASDPPAPSGECPVCGALAALGIHRDEGVAHGGSRELWCSLCETTWRYPRIKCARCGIEHQDELGFRFAEGDLGHRIYTCNACNGTLKVVDEAHVGTLYDPRVEEIVLEDLLDAVVTQTEGAFN